MRRNSRDPEVWQLGPDLMQPVSEMIAREYGVYHERLSQQISDLTGKLVDSYWDNNSGDILDIVDGSFLIDYDEAGQKFQFKSAVAISILYTVLERCGLEPDGHFDRDDFSGHLLFFHACRRVCAGHRSQRMQPGCAAQHRTNRKNDNPPPQCRKEPI